MPLVQSSTESSPHVEGSGGVGTHTEGSGTEANHQQDCVDSRQRTYKAEVLGSGRRIAPPTGSSSTSAADLSGASILSAAVASTKWSRMPFTGLGSPSGVIHTFSATRG